MRAHVVVATSLLTALAGGAAACVDLFHSTDFETLCTGDAAACAPETGSPESSAPDAPPEATAPIDFCTYSSIEAQTHAERACAWMSACKGAQEGSSFGACMVRARAAYDCKLNPGLRPQGATAVLWSCLANVASCAAVDTCLFGGPSPTCKNETAGAFTSCNATTNATTVVECGGEIGPALAPLAVRSCLLEGRSCAKVDEGKSICAGSKQVSCSGGVRCDGTSAVTCSTTGGIAADIGFDCAAFGGGRCVKDDAGVACAPLDEAASCKGTSGITCGDAGTASSCVGGKLITLDCKALDMECQVPPSSLDPLAACTTVPAACTEDTCVTSNLLSGCAQGKAFEVSCGSYGLGPCAKQASPRAPFATCTPP